MYNAVLLVYLFSSSLAICSMILSSLLNVIFIVALDSTTFIYYCLCDKI
uniref:Uncharacterized protein n=1 Tax=Arundo donax TaxID=35708 RepID=A0A0A9B8S1_ARUDO